MNAYTIRKKFPIGTKVRVTCLIDDKLVYEDWIGRIGIITKLDFGTIKYTKYVRHIPIHIETEEGENNQFFPEELEVINETKSNPEG